MEFLGFRTAHLLIPVMVATHQLGIFHRNGSLLCLGGRSRCQTASGVSGSIHRWTKCSGHVRGCPESGGARCNPSERRGGWLGGLAAGLAESGRQSMVLLELRKRRVCRGRPRSCLTLLVRSMTVRQTYRQRIAFATVRLCGRSDASYPVAGFRFTLRTGLLRLVRCRSTVRGTTTSSSAPGAILLLASGRPRIRWTSHCAQARTGVLCRNSGSPNRLLA